MSCIVEGCSTNAVGFIPKGITMHTLPTKLTLLKKWLHVLNIHETPFEWSEDKCVCSRHFQENDYVSNRRTLMADAVPSLFLYVENISVSKMQEKGLVYVEGPSTKEIIPEAVSVSSDSDDAEKNTSYSYKIKVKKCAAPSCKKPGIMMRDFPNPAKDWSLYLDYVYMSENEELKRMAPEDVISTYGICDLHFKKKFTRVPDPNKTSSTVSEPDPMESVPDPMESIKVPDPISAVKVPESITTDNNIKKMYKADQLCRLCFKFGAVSLFSALYDSKQLKDIARLFLPIDFKANDVSTVVCVDCKNELVRFYNFMVKSLEVDEYFQIIIKEANSRENKFEDVLIIDPLPLIGSNDKEFPILESILKKPERDEQIEVKKENIVNNLNYAPQNFINSFHNYAKPEPPKSKKTGGSRQEIKPKPKDKINYETIICIHCNKTIDNIDSFLEHCNVENHGPIFTCSECNKMYKIQEDLEQHVLTHVNCHMCDRCGKQFQKRENLTFHLNTVHNPGNLKFACKECPKKFATNYRLKIHNRLHTNDKPFCCEQCGSVFISLSNLKNHQTIHSDYKPFKCLICNKGFRRKYRLEIHMTKHTDERKFICDKCGVAYKRKVNLTRHNRRYHQTSNDDIDTTDNQPRNCTKCDYSCESAAQLKFHNLKVHKSYSCTICNVTFKSYQPYYNHKFKHNPNKMKFVCTYCNKRFMNATLLNIHMVVHTGKRNFVCEICNKRFSQKPHLQSHMFTHTGEKPHKCKFCSSGFAHLSTLVVHERIHTGETPYVCEFCSKGFGHLTNYKKHVFSQHGVVVPKKRIPPVGLVDNELEGELVEIIKQETISFDAEEEENIEDEKEEVIEEDEEEQEGEEEEQEEEEEEQEGEEEEEQVQYIYIEQHQEQENMEEVEAEHQGITVEMINYEVF